MTENRRSDGHDHDWLDGETAERLLRGESVMSGGAVAARLARLLTAAAAPAAVDPDREAAAAAAFRTSPSAVGPAGPVRPVVPPGTARTVGAGRSGRSARNGRNGRVAGAPRSLKAAAGALVAAVVLCATALVAAPGLLPVPFDGDNVGSAPVHSGAPGSASPSGSDPDEPDGGSSPLTGGTTDAPPGTGTSPEPGRGTTPSAVRPASPADPSATAPSASHLPSPQGTRGERDRQNVELCRAYIKAGGRMDTVSSDRLEAAAGSKRDVPRYCARVLAAAYIAGLGGSGAGDGGKTGGAAGGHQGKGDSRHN